MDGGILLLALASIAILVSSLTYLKNELFDPQGKRSSEATTSELRRFALLRGFKVLSKVRIKEPGGDVVVIENMLIGYFGVALVQTLGARGEYYGTLDGDTWSVTLDGKRTFFDNPVKALSRQESALRALFARKKVYKVPIYRVAYVSSRSSRTRVFVTNKGEILFRERLSSYLGGSLFEKDAGLDVKRVAECVLSD